MTPPDVLTWMRDRILLFDGAMGTMLQQRGLTPGALPELLNIEAPEMVTEIHEAYVRAGADVITANTFQAHELKLGKTSVEAVTAAGVRCARAAGARFVALDVGPLGQMMAPMGSIGFERAYEVFRRQMRAGAAAGADLILIETIADPYEAKAAVLAARENTDLPVFCSMTFQEDGRTFVGCDPLTATVLLQGLGVDALGVNCSLGPALLAPVVETMLTYARPPVLVQANAGLPVIRDGQTVYETGPEAYADEVVKLVRRGVRIVGGCCGTTPAYIRLLRARLEGITPAAAAPRRVTACTSGTRTVILDGVTTAIGERLNPTGKKKMQAALRAGDVGYLLGEAVAQVRAGADVLDVNVSLPELDEPAVLAKVVREVQGVTDAPLQIDSADPAALEAGLRVYNGKPIVNSVNGKRAVMEAVLPLVKKYGALLVCLTLDEDGIPPTAAARVDIARRLRDEARRYGIPEEDLLIDCLVLTVSAQQAQVRETLAAVRGVKAGLGLRTVLGVSNVSFGLPEREAVNAGFLAAALGAGLDAAILNPLSARYREVLDVFRVLNNEDKGAAHYIKTRAAHTETAPPASAGTRAPSLAEIIAQGRRDLAAGAVRARLETVPPLDVIDREFIPALDEVGRRFESGEIFLPQLMQSAQAVQEGFAVIKDHMARTGSGRESRGKILLATVQGDIHDIGKNIVRMLLENYGYDVVDLGKDVPVQTVVDTIRAQDIRLAGLSALMTTTVKSMKDTIAAVRAAGLPCTFMVGGAVLSPDYAEFVGADHYAKDAMESVAIANAHFGH
ncbi:MAG: homocysteine S-methyltransferase family protein [Oscillospiraceae bacterium]|jgi:5-methyltetrahydrofolate--homocysteine methyltransferase|nr:homocysteine S-methyltransferase family protein [Oscillospiraceae bacterium]